VSCHKLSDPRSGLLDQVHVDAILVVLLLVGVQEQVETGKVGEADELSGRCALLLSQGLEELEV